MQNLYDTPGVHLHHRQTAVVHSEDLSCLAPRSRLRGLSFPVCLYHNCSRHIINSICQLTPRYYCQNSQVFKDNEAADHSKSNGLNGFSIFWGGLVRIDVLKVLTLHSYFFPWMSWRSVSIMCCVFSCLVNFFILIFAGSARNMFDILWAQGPTDPCCARRKCT